MAETNFCAGSLIKEAKPMTWIDIQTACYLIGIGTVFGVFIYLTLMSATISV